MASASSELQLLNTIIFLVFTACLMAGAVRTYVRAAQYRHSGLKIPLILWRDLIFVGGLTLPLMLILGARALGLIQNVINHTWWVLVTSTPALIAVITYGLFEFFIIDKAPGREAREPRELREPRETALTLKSPREPREPREERPPAESE